MKTDLIKLYTSVLSAAGAVVDNEGFVSDNKTLYGGENSPLIIKGKRLVLPTNDQLRAMSKGNCVAFHPLFENIMRRESDVITTLRKMISVRLSYTIATIMNSMLVIATSVAEHKKLTPDQSEFLSIVKDADATTMQNFTKYLAAIAKANEATHMCHVYLKHGGKIGDTKFSRVSVITFNAYNEIKAHTDLVKTLRGVRFRIKDRDTILKLFEYIFPNIDQTDAYSAGSNSSVAPYMDSLMQSFYKVAAKINDILVLFSNRIDHAAELTFDSDWVESFQDLSSLSAAIRSIPMQSGNEGESRNVAAVPAFDSTIVQGPTSTPIPAPVVNQPAVMQQYTPQALPTYQTQPVQQQIPQVNNELVTSQGINFRALMQGGRVNQQFVQPQVIQQPQQTFMLGGYGVAQQPQMMQTMPFQNNQWAQQPVQRAVYGGGNINQGFAQRNSIGF